MAMAIGSPDDDGEDQMNSTINTTPLVDVMLVLLIIFMVAAPLATVDLGVDLPACYSLRGQQCRSSQHSRIVAILGDGIRAPTSNRWDEISAAGVVHEQQLRPYTRQQRRLWAFPLAIRLLVLPSHRDGACDVLIGQACDSAAAAHDVHAA